jgi:hypothetical protein
MWRVRRSRCGQSTSTSAPARERSNSSSRWADEAPLRPASDLPIIPSSSFSRHFPRAPTKSDAFAASIFVDELDACGLECATDDIQGRPPRLRHSSL